MALFAPRRGRERPCGCPSRCRRDQDQRFYPRMRLAQERRLRTGPTADLASAMAGPDRGADLGRDDAADSGGYENTSSPGPAEPVETATVGLRSRAGSRRT